MQYVPQSAALYDLFIGIHSQEHPNNRHMKSTDTMKSVYVYIVNYISQILF
jgi:hypothetical protein